VLEGSHLTPVYISVCFHCHLTSLHFALLRTAVSGNKMRKLSCLCFFLTIITSYAQDGTESYQQFRFNSKKVEEISKNLDFYALWKLEQKMSKVLDMEKVMQRYLLYKYRFRFIYRSSLSTLSIFVFILWQNVLKLRKVFNRIISYHSSMGDTYSLKRKS
jgi:hypothetical protein